jgi:exosome complex component CSL4
MKVLPGERLAVIEEFDAGPGTYSDGEYVRAQEAGEAHYDLASRVVAVKPARPRAEIPRPGSVVIGQVTMVQGSIAQVEIQFVDGSPSQARFTGLLLIGGERGRRTRRGICCKRGDIVRARVVSDINAVYHLSIDRREDGVIYTVCSQCGGEVRRVRGRVKCVECGFEEERKLAADFGEAAGLLASLNRA